MPILRGTPEGNGDMIFTGGRNRDNAPGTELAAQRFTIIPFIQAQAFRFTFALPDANSIEGGQDGPLVMSVRFADREVKGMPMSVYHEVSFEP